mgnify:CR=1 FL=1
MNLLVKKIAIKLSELLNGNFLDQETALLENGVHGERALKNVQVVYKHKPDPFYILQNLEVTRVLFLKDKESAIQGPA